MASNSIAKTAILTPFGLWKFFQKLFGLKNPAKAFQGLMNFIFRQLGFAFFCLDDILIASFSGSDHFKHFRQVYDLLSTDGLAINKFKLVLE